MECMAKAPDPTTLAAGGCYVSGNSVMVPPKAGTFGTMGRNIFRDLGFRNLDFSIFKNFRFKGPLQRSVSSRVLQLVQPSYFRQSVRCLIRHERRAERSLGTLRFRRDAGTPDVNAGNPIVGSGSARDIQLGLKLTF